MSRHNLKIFIYLYFLAIANYNLKFQFIYNTRKSTRIENSILRNFYIEGLHISHSTNWNNCKNAKTHNLQV